MATATTPRTTGSTTYRPGLDRLVTRVREHAAWDAAARDTAFSVADLLRADLPGTDILTPAERVGAADTYVRHVLHTEKRFSVVALVWQPGQLTEIHDHIAWCVFGVLQGVEFETLYRDHGDHLTEIGRAANQVGDVSGFAPPGDIHRVHNIGDETAISLHVFGADLSLSSSSVRREYHLPVR
jgi:predicted metal-dependent enzyme (double-stranded beta helix superfamily)